jgi:large repetitive protein
MRPSVNTPSSRAYKLVCRTILILLVATGLVAGIFKMAVSSASPQEQATARFELALRQQRQRARLLVRSSTAESRFQQLATRAIESGVVPVIVTLRVAYSPQVEVRGEIESQAQRYEIGRVGEGIIDELVGYDPASIKHYDQMPFIALTVNGTGVESLRQSDNILDIQEDTLNTTSLAQSVPFIGGTNAWASGFTGAGQTVAILDTGVDKTHPMLAGKVVSEACYSTTSGTAVTSLCPGGASSSTASNSALPCASICNHGTHVAGIAAGTTVTSGGVTFSGVAKDADIIAVQVFSRFNTSAGCSPSAAPCVKAYTSDILSGLQRVYNLRSTYSIASANMSLGGGRNYTNCDGDTRKVAVDLLRAANIATVIASGNDSYKDSISAPGCISTAVSVGATADSANTVSAYSNSASILNLLAPGSGITSSIPGAAYATWNGTSMATPHVAGAWAVAKQKNPGASVTTVLNALTSTGVSITDTNGISKRRIAIDLALATLTSPSEPDAPTDLTARAFSRARVNLTWQDNSTLETGFVLERRVGLLGMWQTLATPAANETSYQDNTVAAATRYYYRIKAINGVGSSSYSEVVDELTYDITPGPTDVLAIVASASRINLTWTDNADNETGYRISRRPTLGVAATVLETVSPNTTSFSSTGLAVLTGYTYIVSAVAPGGDLMSAPSIAATTYAVTAVPTGVAATVISSTQINLSWTDRAVNETGYQVSRGLLFGGTKEIVATLAANTTSYVNKGLFPSTGYSYTVSAIGPGGDLITSPSVAATTYGPTAVPTGVAATAFSSTQINLSWTDAAANETGYRIERRLTSDTSSSSGLVAKPAALSLVANIAANTTSYQNTGLANSTGYTYVVSAIAPGGGLASAAEVAATTYDPTAAPTGVTATAFSSSQINLSWTDNATNETGYRISRRLTSGAVWTVVATTAAGATTYNNTGLTTATGYTYRISAVAPGGALVSAADIAATTLIATAAPTAITATAISKSQINLRWTDAAANETGYRVDRRPTLGLVWETVATLPTGSRAYNDTTGLSPAIGYTYKISAVAPGGTLVSAATVAATTFGVTATPTGVTATAFSSTQINLNWTDAATNETGYRIERRLTLDPSDSPLTLVANLASNIKTYQNTGLTNSTGYTYVVSAIAPGGDPVSAAEVAATTYGPTAAPTGVTPTAVSASRIDLSWTDTATNETGYRIERRQTTGTATAFSLLVNLGAGVTTYSNTGLAAATGYAYRVSAIAPGGAQVSAADATATTFAVTAAPTAFTATAISKSQINLKWTDVATNETGYQIERRLTSPTLSSWSAPVPFVAGVTTYSDTTGLAAATSYTYRVSAIAPGGALVSAATVAATTFGVTATPTGVTATAFSSTRIDLRWTDAATNETGYRIERRLTSDTSSSGSSMVAKPAALSLVANIVANTTSYQNTGLLVSTGYTYVISAIAPGGDPVSAAEVAATTYDPTAAPTAVAATAFSASQINLSWTDNATNETGYRISRRLTTGTVWTDVATTIAGATTYNNTGLTAGTGYTYRVSAVAPGGALVSAAADVSATTAAVTAAPTGFTATAISKTQINLKWNDVATNETGYQVERRLTSPTLSSWSSPVPLAAGVTTYSDTTGLTAATSYTYRVSAIAPGGALVSAATVAATTFGVTAVPTGVTATAFSSTQINLRWTDAATNEIKYKIERRLTDDSVWGEVALLPANTTAYSNTGLANSTGYTYRVSAVAPGGDLVSAAEVAATTYDPTAAPTGVAATVVSATQINLSWTDNATNETGYRISRRLTSGTAWTDLATLAANATSYSNTGLAAATGYSYRVSAVAPGGALVSAEVSATTSK